MTIICLDKNYTIFALFAVSQQNCYEQKLIKLTLVERWTLVQDSSSSQLWLWLLLSKY